MGWLGLSERLEGKWGEKAPHTLLLLEDTVEVVDSLCRQEADVVHWVLTTYGQQPYQAPQVDEMNFHLERRVESHSLKGGWVIPGK